MLKVNVIELLSKRGFIDQMTSPELKEHVDKPIGVYLGFDPTADSLHLGHLMGIIALAWFQKCGHLVYPLVGGATGRIGDPSGKSSERIFLSDEILKQNILCIEKFLKKILSFSEGKEVSIVNNADWLSNMSLIDFLKNVGKYFRVGAMLAKDSVKTRLHSDEGISFTEFSYQALQGYDFCFLNREKGITLQIGGSDQWGNITAGVEYTRKVSEKTVYGLTWPLLTRSDGKKFGKSEDGAIWLSKEKLSPYHFYQYLVRVPDADVIEMLKILTFLPLEEIYRIEQAMEEKDYVPNTAQKKLAEEVTRFVHGEEGLEEALKVTSKMMPGSLNVTLSKEELKELPHVTLRSHEIIGIKFVDLAAKIALVSSKAEGGKLIKNGGAYLNNEKVLDTAFVIQEKDLVEGLYLLLAAGKKKKILVVIEN
jgi:tyrosyl-tRNA synthetase